MCLLFSQLYPLHRAGQEKWSDVAITPTPLVPPAAEGWDEANGYLGIAIGVLITVILLLITIILTILYKNLQQGCHGAPKMGQNTAEVSMLNISQHS